MATKTLEEWRARIAEVQPRDCDLVGPSMSRIAKLHVEMLEELAERMDALPAHFEDRIDRLTSRVRELEQLEQNARADASVLECHRVKAGGDPCDPARTGITWGDACPACRTAWMRKTFNR